MEAATMAADSTEQRSKPVYLLNMDNATVVVGDLGITFAGAKETYDVPCRVVSRQQFENSMNLQMLVADGSLAEITLEQMQDILRGRRKGPEVETGDFEGDLMGEDITPNREELNELGIELPRDNDEERSAREAREHAESQGGALLNPGAESLQAPPSAIPEGVNPRTGAPIGSPDPNAAADKIRRDIQNARADSSQKLGDVIEEQ